MLSKQARVFTNSNLIADFLRGNAELGDIYQLENEGWIIITNIFKLMPVLKKDDFLLSRSSPKDVKFSQETGTSILFGGTGSSGAIGTAQAEISFKKNNSAFVSLKQAVYQNIDLAQMTPIINNLWETNGYKKKAQRYFFVNQICTAQSGVTLFSAEKNNTIKIESTVNKALSNVGIIAEGKIEIVANKKETLEIISDTIHSPLFQAVRMKNNGLWDSMR